MKDLKIYTIVSITIAIIVLYVFYRKPEPVSWAPTYVRTHKIPYGTNLVYGRIGDLFDNPTKKPVRKRVYNTIEDQGPGVSANYLIIASHVDIDQTDYTKLMAFVSAGNEVFVAARDMGDVFYDSLKIEARVSRLKDIPMRRQYVKFTNPTLSKEEYHFDRDAVYSTFTSFDTARAVVVAQNGVDDPVILRYPVGKGNIYFVSNPDFFVNYNMLRKDGEAFSALALSHLSVKPLLLWDDFNTMGPVAQDSPFRVLLNDPYLRYAYLISLMGLIMFVLYGVKRTQRVIPVVEPLKNTSVEFAKVVSSIYYQKGDHLDIAQKQVSYFLEHLRARYHVKTQVLDQDLADQIAVRSGVEASVVNRLFQYIQDIRAGHITVSADTLISLNRTIEKFHQQELLWKNQASGNVPTSTN